MSRAVAMLGIQYLKCPPTTYILHYQEGEVVREGAGLAFFYYAPFSEIVAVPLAALSVPFVFHATTADIQQATLHGELAFRITDARRVAGLLDLSLDAANCYRTSDLGKLSQWLAGAVQNFIRRFAESRTLRELLTRSSVLAPAALASLRQSELVERLGVEIVDLTTHSLTASPETDQTLAEQPVNVSEALRLSRHHFRHPT